MYSMRIDACRGSDGLEVACPLHSDHLFKLEHVFFDVYFQRGLHSANFLASITSWRCPDVCASLHLSIVKKTFSSVC